MTKAQGGIGRQPGRKREEGKRGTQRPTAAMARDIAAIVDAERRAADALQAMTTAAPAAEAPTPTEPEDAAPFGARYFRELLEKMTEQCDRENRLKREANERARKAEAGESRWKALAEQRKDERDAAREDARAWAENVHQVEDEMDGLAESPAAHLPVIGKESRGDGGGKGRKRWPLWIVELIIEQLIHGTPPAAIPDNILSQDRLVTGRDGQEVPSVGFCRDMRVVLRILDRRQRARARRGLREPDALRQGR